LAITADEKSLNQWTLYLFPEMMVVSQFWEIISGIEIVICLQRDLLPEKKHRAKDNEK
jgi:hypothetical protein